jgi:hypothetical protein
MEYQNKIIPVLKAMGSFQFPLWDTAVKGCIDEALKTFQFPFGIPTRMDFSFVFGYPGGTFYLIFNLILGL